MISKIDSKTLISFVNDLSTSVKFSYHKDALISYIHELTDKTNKTVANAAFDKSDKDCFHTIRAKPNELDNTETRKSEKKKGFKVMTAGESERGQKHSPKMEK